MKLMNEINTLVENEVLRSIGRRIAGKSQEKDSSEQTPSSSVVTQQPATGSSQPAAPAPTQTVPVEEKPKEFKIGDVVIPNVGPHANIPHLVTKVIQKGDHKTYNIKPRDLEGEAVKYKDGGANATADQLALNEEKTSVKYGLSESLPTRIQSSVTRIIDRLLESK